MTDVDRQTQLAREHRERQEARDKRSGAPKRNIIIGGTVGAVVVVGGIVAASTLMGGGDGAKNPAASASASASPGGSAPPSAAVAVPTAPGQSSAVTCTYRKDDSGSPAKKVGTPPAKPDMKAKTMTITTNQGAIVIELATAQAPCTVNSFEFLAKKNFFDNTRCHRLATVELTGLAMLQCGDPFAKGDGKTANDGAGGPGYLFNDENLNGTGLGRGTVAMAANSEDANSNGSQFWISYADDNTQLASSGAAFTTVGVVKKGMDVVDKIVKGGVIVYKNDQFADVRGEGSNAPKLPVIIKDVKVER
ncbi:peptidylprolyl isomerase [Sphaerisporangium rufum]|uniref:Peptidylprolyl isomerase n=1 Tax=Sphaerisporangium rufum TaxID=1381558 RepID=A0A919V3I1_9ACTN|nr:peptidylprolyl isomerase [Sphaerisporangium rufum]GII80847.1 peptidylprolyl isomerase [Sphaerisporangium rufum]